MKSKFASVILWDNTGGYHSKVIQTWKHVSLDDITSEVAVEKYLSNEKLDIKETGKWSLECHFPQVSPFEDSQGVTIKEGDRLVDKNNGNELGVVSYQKGIVGCPNYIWGVVIEYDLHFLPLADLTLSNLRVKNQ